MKEIQAFENAITNRVANLAAEGINSTAFWAYRKSRENGNERLDFNEVIWDEDIEAIAATLEQNGITEFTISSTFSGLIATLVAFEKLGYKTAGTIRVNASYKNWQTETYEKIDALLMRKG